MPELLPKIAELSAKLQKEPGSRLFVPLAEEYVKAGMLEEAVQVLTDGLKKHPEFLVARVTLGKIYFQQGKFAEARRELEAVVTVSPDNLVALRKLAVLYRQDKLLDKARHCCELLLAANPKDAEIQQLLQELNAALQPKEERAEMSMSAPKLDLSRGSAAEQVTEPNEAPSFALVPSQNTTSFPSQSSPPTPSVESETPQKSMGKPDAGEDAPDELVSPTLAQLYLRQGHYAQAVRVYDELLRREPHNDTYRQAHAMALTLLQGQQPQPQTASSPAVEPGGEVVPNAGPPADRTNNRLLQRLQSWLHHIQQQRRRGAS
jgi:tetratricopeptide (TPR) repeat protein